MYGWKTYYFSKYCLHKLQQQAASDTGLHQLDMMVYIVT
jgi:hypothetical protein